MDEFTEIERRFLVDAREEKPWREGAERIAIRQHYGVGDLFTLQNRTLCLGEHGVCSLSEDEVGFLKTVESWTTRLRQKNEVFIISYKSRIADDTAIELEWTVDESMAQMILAKGPFPFVEKIRYVLPGPDGILWEVDEFEGALAGLVLAEVELPSSQTSVVLPAWAGHEITGLGSWSNRALAETLSKPSK